MTPIETIVFDLGNVLLPFNWDLAADRFCARCGCDRRRLDDYIVTTPFVQQLALGQMTKEKFFQRLAGDFSFPGDYDEFARLWSDIFTEDQDMTGQAARLKGRYRRYILSNTNAIHIEFILSRYPFMRDFEGHIFSQEVGLEKPDPQIYRLTAAKFGLTPARTVFIDDILANIEAARAEGWHGIHHQSGAQTRAELTKLGVTPI